MRLDVPDWRMEIDPTICLMLTSNDVYITITGGYDAHITISHDFIDLRIRTSGSVSALNATLGSSKFVESTNNLALCFI